MSKKLLIRADGDTQIGIGHITRCLYFVETIKNSCNTIFLIKENSQIKEYITQRNYLVDEIPSNLSLNEEIDTLLSKSADLLIIDLLNKDDLYYQKCAKNFDKVLRFDDSHKIINIFSHFYLNYNLYSENVNYNIINEDCILFLGPKYYILNPVFRKYENYKRSFRSKARNILLTMGGGDPKNLTLKIAKAIINLEDIYLDIILGKLFKRPDEIEELKNRFPDKISIYKDVNNIPEMMARNDLIIGTGGNTSFEAAFMGLPGVLINQINLQGLNAEKYEEKRIFKNGGLGDDIGEEEIRVLVENLVRSKQLRKEFHKNGKKLISINWVDLVIDKFLN